MVVRKGARLRLAVASFALACGAIYAAARADTPAAGAAVDVIVTRPILDPAPPNCRPASAAAVVLEFFDAFNRGDLDALDRLVAPGGEGRFDFKWFSLSESDGPVSRPPFTNVALYSKTGFLAYAAERHRQGERLSLVFLQSSTPQSGGRAVGIVYVIRREADDLLDRLGGLQRVATGKGAIDCAEGRFFVWSMGMHMAATGALTPATYSGTLCPVPRGWRHGESPPVACWNGPNARAALRGFRAPPSSPRIPNPCNAESAIQRIRAVLAGYNIGDGEQVARTFSRAATVRLSRDMQPAVTGRRRIAALVRGRYDAGEGWTAVKVVRASIGKQRVAYRLMLRITQQGSVRGTRRVTQSVDCRSGLITQWAELGWLK